MVHDKPEPIQRIWTRLLQSPHSFIFAQSCLYLRKSGAGRESLRCAYVGSKLCFFFNSERISVCGRSNLWNQMISALNFSHRLSQMVGAFLRLAKFAGCQCLMLRAIISRVGSPWVLLREHEVGWSKHICIHSQRWSSRPCLHEAEVASTTCVLGVYIVSSGLA